MVFWPNLRRIGGYVFSEIGHLFIPIFGPFLHFFDNFWPVFGYKSQKHTKLDPLGAKRTKEIEKIGSEALLQIRVPKQPKIHPWAKKHPKIELDG